MKCPKCGSEATYYKSPITNEEVVECDNCKKDYKLTEKQLTTAEKLMWLVENVFQINIINSGCSIEIRPNNSCEEARYFIGVDAAYEWAKENK